MTFNVQQSSYYDMTGNLLWTEPMRFSRLDGVGDTLIHDNAEYRVRKVAVAGSVQIVNLETARSPTVGKLTDMPIIGYGRGSRR